MPKVKRVDGTIEEVEEGYVLQEGEEFVEEEKEEESKIEEETKEELKSYIQQETIDTLEKELDKVSNELVSKFFDGVKEQRKKYITTGVKPKNLSDQEIVRKWFDALLKKDYATIRIIQKDYLNITDDAQGGYLVPPPQLVTEVNRFVEEYGIARSDMRYLPFSDAGNERKIPALDAAVSVYWVGEAGAKPSTKPTFKLVTQTLKKLAAIVPITEELLQDSAIDIIKLLGELFGEAIAREEDRVFLTGRTANGDPYDGILYASGVVNVDMGTGKLVDDITADDLLELIYAVPTSIQKTGTFYLSPAVFKRIQQLKDAASGQYIVQSPVGSQPATIWGRPYKLVQVLPDDTINIANTPFMFFTDLSKTAVYGDKGGLQVKLLDQAVVQTAEESPTDLNLATQDMVALRVVKRVGYVPVLPNGIAVLRTGASS